ncbi:hypothetical protein S40288_08906 [Stachybotrys chartarum IBT 40288]|nr:hypothetical protein S40288_08906 [Stachybotrys chartarum IBT 40288]
MPSRVPKLRTPSVAVFCPQSKAPQEEFLNKVRSYILSNVHLQRLAADAKKLIETWELVAGRRDDIADLHQGPRYMQAISDWLTYGHSGPVSNIMSGILSLPLLVIIQTVQHFQFLELSGMTHSEFLAGLVDGKGGGAQGYCAGLLPAFAIACATDEKSLITASSKAMRIALAIGAYGELGDDKELDGPTTIVLRLKYAGQGDDIVKGFPGAYVSAVTDPKTISIVGPVRTLEAVSEFARNQGLLVQSMHLRGKVHNPENLDLAAELCALCDEFEDLQLPSSDKLQVPVNSNKDGRPLKNCNLTHEAIYTILATRCEWYSLLQDVAESLRPARTGTDSHAIVLFGIGDPVPLSPFHQTHLNITKIEVHRILMEAELSSYSPGGDDIAIVGASCRLPGASNLEELWNLISSGSSTCEPVRPERVPVRASFRASQDQTFGKKQFFGNFVDDIEAFDHAFFKMSPKEAISMDPQQRVLLELAYEAMDSAGYLRHHERDRFDNVGCFIGASFTEYLENTAAHTPSAYAATGTIRAFLCGKISYYFGWSGPSEVIDTACSSSLVAIHRACRAIAAGECAVALTGGVNIITGVQNYIDLGKAGFLSPTGQCKPFDTAADGYCRADGAGLVVLKKLSDAVANGDEVLGVITGVATNQGGLSSSITVPHSRAQIELYKTVLAQSAMHPDHVTYVEAHGTGTQAGDPLEMASLREVFGGPDRLSSLHIGSLKGNIGHCETAAGVAGLLKVLAMLRRRKIPPLASHKKLNPKIPALASSKMVLDKRVENWDAPIRVACVNSYGAAGSNAALLCCEGPARPQVTPTMSLSTVPILISAASKESLLSYGRSLSKYLDDEEVDVRDLAFTLGERRKRHRFIWSSAASDLASLRKSLQGIFHENIRDTSQPCKKVVLAFAGQSKQIVGLDKTLYESNTALGDYIKDCDSVLTRLGFPAIIPAVFDKAPLSDVVVLQTGTFAVQYACARCWIDAGIQVEAVIGHSFGELTALVISGVLSLEDGIKLVATRASLMASEWGPERGIMLMVHSSRDIVRDVVSAAGADDLEVACYNSKTSQVLVGSRESVARAEQVLKSDARFRNIRYQRLDVSHGFHSQFTEPLLPHLLATAETLSFNHPTIYLETCTAEAAQTLSPRHIVQHTRKAVYFSDAVQRLEKRLGSCIWLEAGINSSIIPLVKRATSESSHVFQEFKLGDGQDGLAVLSSLTMNLWTEGLPVTFWPFLSPQDAGRKPIWLPPNAFTRTRAYLENIDRATEAQKAQALSPAPVEATEIAAPALLVTPLEKQSDSMNFSIHIDTNRFSNIVSGHAVRSRPLCPASMYMECTVMAAQHFHGNADFSTHALHFENLSFESPLGLDLSRRVQLKLSKADSPAEWVFLLHSYPNSKQPSTRATTHGKGTLMLSEQPNFDTYQRLISSRLPEILVQSDAETLLSKRAYGLFSQVVTYADLLRGIQTITMSGNHALAAIRVQDGHVGADESSAIHCCDTVALDTFIQVVGLLINSSDHCSPGCCFVASGVKTATLGLECNFNDSKSWAVYATYTMLSDTKAMGDVFVMKPDHTIVGTILGVSFSRLPIDTLERMLDGVNVSTTAKASAKKGVSSTGIQDAVAQKLPPIAPTSHGKLGDSGYTSDSGSAGGHDETNEVRLKDLIATYTGAAAEAIDSDAAIGELGVDSLAAVELAADITAQFGKAISPNDLSETSVAVLLKDLGAKAAVSTPNHAPMMDPPLQNHTTNGQTQSVRRQIVFGIVEDVSGAGLSEISEDRTLRDLGVDSLAVVQLKGDLEVAFSVEFENEDIDIDLSVRQILNLVGSESGTSIPSATPVETPNPPCKTSPETYGGLASALEDHIEPAAESVTPAYLRHPADTLLEAQISLPKAAARCGLESYWKKVAPRQDEIVVAYIMEAFRDLDVDLWALEAGEMIPPLRHLPKHDKVMQRFFQMLQKHGIIERAAGTTSSWVRTPMACQQISSRELTDKFVDEFPQYESEAKLMLITGPSLAGCLTGRTDPMALLFSSRSSQMALQEFYSDSPILATATEFLSEVVGSSISASVGPSVRIIEIGAGFGGTTKRLLETIANLNRKIEYTFTDVAATLVNRASKVFGNQYNSDMIKMDFKAVDIENDLPEEMKGRYDLAISTNCVHATHDKTVTISNIKSLLNPHGHMVLSEVTEIIDWYDIVYGLLDGWWYAPDGAYPLQPSLVWMQCFKKAGLHGSYSQGLTRDLRTQRLLIGSHQPSLSDGAARNALQLKPRIETVVYKVIDGIDVHADIYLPSSPPEDRMSIALMIHGGGHMTLSRKAIRPAQAAYLLSHGVLPVSVDYRLCPEINLIDGPMADVRDAYSWAKKQLASLVEPMGVTVEPENIAVVGWSTGGHLAMTLGWGHEAGAKPPKAIVSFYGPTDFESGDLDVRRAEEYPERQMAMSKIIAALPKHPITSYESTTDSTGLGWVQPGDPRSELVLSLFKEGNGLPLLLNGISGDKDDHDNEAWKRQVSSDRIAAINPMAKVRDGSYTTPTFVVHGTRDEIVPYAMAADFVQTCRGRGVECGFLTIPGARHIHDLNLEPGTVAWEAEVAPAYEFLLSKLAA